jgi:hypothetical protein
LLLINLNKAAEASINAPVSGERFTLSSPDLESTTVLLNGAELKAAPDGTVPQIKGQPFQAGTLRFAPATITILTMPAAHNPGCTR